MEQITLKLIELLREQHNFLVKQYEDEMTLEKLRIQANKEKWETGMKHLTKSGAIEKIAEQVGCYLNKPKNVQSAATIIPETEYFQNLLDNDPLLAHIKCLNMSIVANNEIKELLESELNESLYENLMTLLNSNSKEACFRNFSEIKNSLKKSESDYRDLKFIFNKLNENQKKVVLSTIKLLENFK